VCRFSYLQKHMTFPIRMRKLGSYITGDMNIVVKGDLSVKKADGLSLKFKKR
jgi:divalent metal cation (Fe/Co/Zn/Cd) transporter